MDQKGQVEGLKNAVGVVAEMSLIYFRACRRRARRRKSA